MALDGPLWVRAWHEDAVHVFELEPEDACYLPVGSRHEYRNAGGGDRAGHLRHRARATCRDRRRRGRRRRDEARGRARRRRERARPRRRAAARPSRGAVRRPCWPTAVALVGELAGDGAARPGSRCASSSTRRARAERRDRRLARHGPALRVRRASSPTCAPPRVAEARFGAGRGEPDFLYVSVGTGISHCLVTGGRPRAGVHGSAIGTGAPLVERWSGGLALARRSGHATAGGGAGRPGRARPWSRTRRGASAPCSRRSSTRSTPARVDRRRRARAARRLPRARRSRAARRGLRPGGRGCRCCPPAWAPTRPSSAPRWPPLPPADPRSRDLARGPFARSARSDKVARRRWTSSSPFPPSST